MVKEDDAACQCSNSTNYFCLRDGFPRCVTGGHNYNVHNPIHCAQRSDYKVGNLSSLIETCYKACGPYNAV